MAEQTIEAPEIAAAADLDTLLHATMRDLRRIAVLMAALGFSTEHVRTPLLCMDALAMIASVDAAALRDGIV